MTRDGEAQVRDWQQNRQMCVHILEQRTGEGVDGERQDRSLAVAALSRVAKPRP